MIVAPKRRHLLRWMMGGITAVIAAAIAAVLVLSGGDLGYAARVLSHGDSDTDDITWKTQQPIAAADPAAQTTAAGCEPFADAIGADLPATLAHDGAVEFVVVRDGATVCEWEAPGHHAGQLWPLFSVSKTVVALAIAEAVQRGELSWDDPITRWIPELADRDARFDAITLGDLVDMRSGIAFDDVVRFPWLNQDPARVYYAGDLAEATLTHPAIASAPGPFLYNDWAPNLLGVAFQRATGRLVTDEAVPRLWSEIGAVDEATWAVDDQGFPWHESGLAGSARDLARVGQILIDRPPWAQEFVTRTLAAPLDPVTAFGSSDLGYSTGWWLGRSGSDRFYAALGRFGQVMVVDPDTRTVIVQLGRSGYEDVAPNAEIARRLGGWAAAEWPEGTP